MRGYLRGAEIAGVMAEHLRDLGFPARPQTNRDATHTPNIASVGLGELSLIGETVLNPFVGPRFKSVVLRYGRQSTSVCSGENCFKCGECDAIRSAAK